MIILIKGTIPLKEMSYRDSSKRSWNFSTMSIKNWVQNLKNTTTYKKDNRRWQSEVILRMPGCFKSWKSINTIHHINRKNNDQFNECRKGFDKIQYHS